MAVIEPKDRKSLKACPACGSMALDPLRSRASQAVDVALGATTGVPLLAPNGKRCRECGWQVG